MAVDIYKRIAKEKKDKEAKKEKLWDDLLRTAKSQQQEYYEFLPEWTIYKENEYKYLKLNIGYSLYGPPTETNCSSETTSTQIAKAEKEKDIYSIKGSEEDDISDQLCYAPKAQAVIDKLFDQIYKYGHGSVDEKSIHYEIIFNVTLPLKDDLDIDKENNLRQTPIFKIRRKTEKKEVEVWYIDAYGRVYRNWAHYKETNILPECTMILPKDGYYQTDIRFEATEEHSTVWLEIVESPRSKWAHKFVNFVDTASTVAGVAAIAAIFAPAIPVVTGAAVIAGSGAAVWGGGRSAHTLIDRSVHKQSITDKEAFASWLNITVSVVGVAAQGATTIITKSAQSGKDISTFAMRARDLLTYGNLALQGFGLGYQAYHLYSNYREGEGISKLDVLNFTMNVLFFGNAVMDVKLAKDIIKSTQGQVLEDYRSNLKSKNSKRKFNRVKRRAAENNTNPISENAEVIRYINKRTDMERFFNSSTKTNIIENIVFENGKIQIYGVTLLDPMLFLKIFLDKQQSKTASENAEDQTDNAVVAALKNLLAAFLEQFISQNRVYNGDLSKFNEVVNDMKDFESAPMIFTLIFKIALTFITNNETVKDCLANAVSFLWHYLKANISQIPNSKKIDALTRLVTLLFEHLDESSEFLKDSVVKYVHAQSNI